MEFYGFKLSPDTCVEQVYSLDKELQSYCLKFRRLNYPFEIFIKFSPDFSEIFEYYPYYFKDFKTSIDLFTGTEKYNIEKFGDPSEYCFNFISYDGINSPSQIYDCNNDGIKRYDNDKLDRYYLLIYNKDISESSKVPDELRHFILEKNPDYIILYLDTNDILLKIIMGFDKKHNIYEKVIKEFKKAVELI